MDGINHDKPIAKMEVYWIYMDLPQLSPRDLPGVATGDPSKRVRKPLLWADMGYVYLY